jgi:4-carboxymuconolactone decarboxylase
MLKLGALLIILVAMEGFRVAEKAIEDWKKEEGTVTAKL